MVTKLYRRAAGHCRANHSGALSVCLSLGSELRFRGGQRGLDLGGTKVLCASGFDSVNPHLSSCFLEYELVRVAGVYRVSTSGKHTLLWALWCEH